MWSDCCEFSPPYIPPRRSFKSPEVHDPHLLDVTEKGYPQADEVCQRQSCHDPALKDRRYSRSSPSVAKHSTTRGSDRSGMMPEIRTTSSGIGPSKVSSWSSTPSCASRKGLSTLRPHVRHVFSAHIKAHMIPRCARTTIPRHGRWRKRDPPAGGEGGASAGDETRRKYCRMKMPTSAIERCACGRDPYPILMNVLLLWCMARTPASGTDETAGILPPDPRLGWEIGPRRALDRGPRPGSPISCQTPQ
jgi:hypothetical protein